MSILTVKNISLSFGTDEILKDISFSVNEKDKVGIIGANGAGKTTLLNIICGKIESDGGSVIFSKGAKAKMLSQKLENEFKDMTVYEWALSSFSDLLETEKELSVLQSEVSAGNVKLANRFSSLSEEFKKRGGLEYRGKTKSALFKFGFSEDDLSKKVTLLSGGQKTKLALISVMNSDCDIIVLDEPTNHLDMDTVCDLEDFIFESDKTFLIVSHDRYFLDKVTNKTLEIENRTCSLMDGSYSVFCKKKKELFDAQLKHWINQQKEIKRIEDFIENQRKWNRERNIIAAESRLKALDRMEKVEKPITEKTVSSFFFADPGKSSYDVLSVKNISKSFGNQKVLENVSFELKSKEKLFITGANGTGKSTLLKIITGMILPDSGTFEIGYNVSVGYYDQEQQIIDNSKTVIEELWADNNGLSLSEVRTALASFGFFGDDVFKENSVLSGGERARLSIAKLIFKGASLLILDEPTNHLDIKSVEVLENALVRFPGSVLCVSHDRYFISSIAESILEVDSLRYPEGYKLYHLCYNDFLRKRPDRTIAPESPTENKEQKQKRPDQRKIKKRMVVIENDIKRREEKVKEKEEEIRGSAGFDYILLEKLLKEKSALEDEISALYGEYFELDESLE